MKRFASLLLSLSVSSTVLANPQGAQVIAGDITMQQNGDTLHIQQNSNQGIINWQSFDIQPSETTHIQQPQIYSTSLHRVTGNNLSQIYGTLSSNGTVMLVNPSGFFFGNNAKVNVGSLIATTGNIINDDYLNNNFQFNLPAHNNATIINHGDISVQDSGLVALVAPEVQNHGVINASLGHVALGSGITTVDLYGDELIHFAVSDELSNSRVDNSGQIYAPGGTVQLSVKNIQNTVNNIINIDGVVSAKNVFVENGDIILGSHSQIKAQKKAVVFAKRNLYAHGEIKTEPGGFIETSAHQYVDLQGIRVNAGKGGTWLIDPTDITIDDALAATYNTTLGLGTNVVVQTAAGPGNGDITVNNTGTLISWSTSATLTLNAHRDIVFNNLSLGMNAIAGAGNIVLRADFDADASGTVTFIGGGLKAQAGTGNVHVFYNTTNYEPAGRTDYVGSGNISSASGEAYSFMLVNNLTDLEQIESQDGLDGTRDGTYALGADIDASATTGFNGGLGWQPIGQNAAGGEFRGVFEGNNHSINQLFINRTTSHIGLFGRLSNAPVRNVKLTNLNLTTTSTHAGGVAGLADGAGTVIDNVKVTGTVTGTTSVGGAIGEMTTAGMIRNSASGVVVLGDLEVGGFLGTLNVTGTVDIDRIYATGNVTSTGSDAGGLVGAVKQNGTVTIDDVYAVGNVSATSNRAGGLIGHLNNNNATVNNAFSIGSVSAASNAGGLVGQTSSGTVTNSYWNTETSGQAGSDGGSGRTTAQMKTQATFVGWDFATPIWTIDAASTYPYFNITGGLTSQIIIGDVYTDQGTTPASGNETVTLAVNGTVLRSTSTLADGSYYFLFDGSTNFSDNDEVLVYINDNAQPGGIDATTIYVSDGSNISGLPLWGGAVLGRAATGKSIDAASFISAKGTLVDTDIIFNLIGNDINTVGNALNLDANSISLDGVTASSLVMNATAINIDGDLTLTSAFSYDDPITLTDNVVITTGGDFTANNSINGAFNLTLDVGGNDLITGSAGNININTLTLNNIGTITLASDITTTSALTIADAVALADNATITANAGLNINSTVDAANNSLTLASNNNINTTMAMINLGNLTVDNNTGGTYTPSTNLAAANNITINKDLNLTATRTLTSTAGNISVADVDGSESLNLTASAGTVSITGNVGSVIALDDLVVSANAMDLGGDVTTNNAFTLSVPTTMTANSNITAGGTVTLNNAITGAFDLGLDAGGNNLVTNSAGNININTLTLSNIAAITLFSDITTTTALTIVDAITLGDNATITANAGLNINNTIDAANFNLTLASNNNINTTMALTNLGNLTVNNNAGGAYTPSTDLTATNNITINKDLNLNANRTLTSIVGNVSVSDVDGAQALNLTAAAGTVSINGDIGSVTALSDLNITSTAINLGGDVTTSNAFTTVAPITMTGNSTVTANPGININSSLDGGGFNLVLDSNNNVVTTTNLINLGDLTIDNNSGGTFTLAGDITASGTVTVNKPFNLTAARTITSTGGNVNINNTVDGAQTFNVSAATGTVTLGGNLGSSTALDDLNLTASAINLGANITTNNAFTLPAATTMTTNSVVTAGGDININGAVSGAFNLTLDAAGSNLITNTAGNININTLTLSNIAAITLFSDITTVTALTLVDAITLGADSVITSNAGLNINNIIDAANFNLTLASNNNINTTATLSNLGSLTVNNNSGGVYTPSTDLTATNNITITKDLNLTATRTLTSTAGDVSVADVDGAQVLNLTAASGTVAINGDVGAGTTVNDINITANALNLGGDITTASPFTFDINTTMTGNSIVTATSGNIVVSNIVDGDFDLGLVASAGNVDVNANIGGNTAVNSLALTGTTVNVAADLTADASQTIDANFNLTGNRTIISNTGDINFNATHEGPNNLTLTSTLGNITISSNLGGVTPLGITTLNAPAGTATVQDITTNTFVTNVLNTIVNGNVILVGPLVINDPIVLTSDLTISAIGNITLNNTITGAFNLIFDTGNNGFISSAPGNINVGSVSFNNNNTISLGSDITTTSALIIPDPMTLTDDVTLTSAAGITFNNTIDAATNDLVLNSSGNIAINNAISNLGALTLQNNSGDIFTTAVDLNATGNITIDRSYTHTGTKTFTSGGDITLADTDGTGTLNLTAATGTITLGNTGSVTPLTNLNLIANAISLGGGISTVNTFVLPAATTLTAAASIVSTTGQIIINGTIDGAQSLILNAPTDKIDINANIGSITPITSQVMSGTGIDLGGNIALSTGTVFSTPIILTANSAIITNAGDVNISTTIDGAYDLALSSNAASLTIGGDIGSTTAVNSLTLNGAGINLGADITTTGALTIDDPTLLTSDSVITTGGAININNSITGVPSNLTFDAGNNNFVTSALGNISVNTLTFNNILAMTLASNLTTVTTMTLPAALTMAADVQLTAGDDLNLNSTINGGGFNLVVDVPDDIVMLNSFSNLVSFTTQSDADGTFTMSGNIAALNAVVIDKDIVMNAFHSIASVANDITINAKIDGVGTFILNAASGVINLNDAVGSVTTLSNIALTATAVNIGNNITINSSFNVTIPMILTGNSIITTNNGQINAINTIDGAYDLSFVSVSNNSINLVGGVGDTTPLSSLTFNGGSIYLDGNISTTSALTIPHSTTIASNSTITAGGDINVNNSITGAFDLTFNAGGNNFITNTLGDINVDSLTFTNIGSMTLSSDLTTTPAALIIPVALTLGADSQLTANGINLNNTVTGSGFNLVLDSGSNIITSANMTGLASFTTQNDSADTITLGGDITATGSINLDRDLVLVGTKTLTSNTGSVNIDAVDGGGNLNLTAANGTVTLAAAVGATTAPNNLNITANAINLGADVTTNNTFTIGSDTTLTGNSVVTSTSGNVVVNNTIDGANNLTLTSTTGTLDINANIGSSTAISMLAVNGNTIELGSDLTSSAAFTVSDPTTLTANSNINAAGNINVNNSIDGAFNLVFDAGGNNFITNALGNINVNSITFNGLGAMTLFSDLTTTAALTIPVALTLGADVQLTATGINLNNTVTGGGFNLVLDSSGNIVIANNMTGLGSLITQNDSADTLTLGGNITATNGITIDRDLSVTGTRTITSNANNINLNDVVDGANTLNLTAAAGTVNITNNIGGTTALNSFNITANAINLGANVTTNNAFTLTAPTTLTADTILDAGGDININNSISGGSFNLVVDANNNNFATNTVGNINVNALTFNNINAMTLSSDLTSNAALTLPVALALGDNVTLTSNAGINLNSTTNGSTHDLTLDSSANIVASGAMTNLGDLTLQNDGGASFSASGDITAANTIIIDRDFVLVGTRTVTSTAANINIDAVDGAGVLNLVAASGTVTLGNDIGATTAPNTLNITANALNLGANVTTNNTFTFAADTILTGNSVVTSNTGDVVVNSSIDGAQDLTLTSMANIVDINANIGSTTPLTSLTINSNNGIDLNADISTQNTFTLNEDVTLSGNSIITSNTGNISVNNVIDGANNLTMSASSGNVDINANLGSTTALAALTVNASMMNLGANITSDNTFNHSTNTTLTGAAVITSNTGNIVLNNTVDGTQDLTLTSTLGNVTANANIGSGTALDDFIINAPAGTATVQSVTAASFATNVTSLVVNGSMILASALTIADPITLTSNTTFATNGDIIINNPITGAFNLILDANGNNIITNTLGNIDVNALTLQNIGTISLSSDITTNSALTIPDPIILGDAVTITSNGDLNINNSITGAHNLTLDTSGGNLVTNSAGDINVNDITFNNIGNINLSADLTTTSALTIADQITLGDNVALRANPGITINDTVNGGGFNLVLDSQINIVTSNALTNLNNLTLQNNVSGTFAPGGDISANGTVTIDRPYALTGTRAVIASNINMNSSIDGAGSLNLNAAAGAVVLAADIGGATPLNALNITANAISLAGDITTNNTFTLAAATAFSGNRVITSNAGSIIVNDTIDGAGDLTLNAAAGTISINSNIGSITDPNNLTLNTTAINLNGGLFTDNTFTIAANTTLTGASSITSTTGDIIINNPVDGTQDLTLTATLGDVTASVDLGTGTALEDLTVNAPLGTGTFQNITAASLTNNMGNFVLNGLLTLTAGLTIVDPLILTNDTTIIAGGDIIINNTITGSVYNLIIDPGGNNVISNSLGNIDVLSLAFQNTNMLSLASDITTTAALTIVDPLTLTDNVTLTTNGGINLNTTVNAGGNDLVLNTPGNVSTIGTITNLNNFTMQNNATSTFTPGADITATGLVTIDRDLTLVGTRTLTGSNINVLAIDGAGTLNLTATGGGVTLGGDVGSNTAVNDLNITASTLTLGGSITSNNDFILDENTVLTNNSVITSNAGNVVVNNVINGPHDLTLSSTLGAVNVNNDIGASNALNRFNVSGAGLNLAADINTTNDITIGANTTLTANNVLSSNSGNITINSRVDGAQDITLSALSGTVNISADIGGVTPLNDINVAANRLSLGADITTNNSFVLAADTILTNNATLSAGGDININSGIAGAFNLVLDAANNDLLTTAAINVNELTLNNINNIQLGANVATNNSLTLSVPLTLANAVILSSNNDVNLNSIINGNQTLVVNAGGIVRLNNVIGGLNPLGQLNIVANGIQVTDPITTSQDLVMAGNIVLQDEMVLTSIAADIVLTDSLSAQRLTLNATNGEITLAADTNINDILFNSDQINLAGAVTTISGLRFDAPVSLTGDTVLKSTSDIRFNSTVDGAFNLTLDPGAASINFADIVGGGTRLAKLQIDNSNQILLGTVHVEELQIFAAAGATLSGTIDGLAGGAAAIRAQVIDGASGTFLFNNCPMTVGCGGSDLLARNRLSVDALPFKSNQINININVPSISVFDVTLASLARTRASNEASTIVPVAEFNDVESDSILAADNENMPINTERFNEHDVLALYDEAHPTEDLKLLLKRNELQNETDWYKIYLFLLEQLKLDYESLKQKLFATGARTPENNKNVSEN